MQQYDLRSSTDSQSNVSAKTVVFLLEEGRFPFTSQVFCSETKIWKAVHEVPALARLLSLKLTGNSVSYNQKSLFHHWCLKDYPSPKGSYNLLEVVSLYQSKKVPGDTLITHPSVSGWFPMGGLAPFNGPSIKVLFALAQLRPSFTARRNPRVRVKKNVLFSQGERRLQGICWSLSTQGLGFDTLEKTSLQVGDPLAITLVDFENGQDVDFECEVVSRVPQRTFDSIGVKFDDVDEVPEDILHSLSIES